MVGTTLLDIRDHIESIASEDGRYYLVCARTGDRPVPATDVRFAGLPVIVVTSLEEEEDKRRGLEAGADAYLLKKSFNQGSLFQTLERFLGPEPA